MAAGIAYTGRTGHIQKGGTKKLNVPKGEKMDIKEESSVILKYKNQMNLS